MVRKRRASEEKRTRKAWIKLLGRRQFLKQSKALKRKEAKGDA